MFDHALVAEDYDKTLHIKWFEDANIAGVLRAELRDDSIFGYSELYVSPAEALKFGKPTFMDSVMGIALVLGRRRESEPHYHMCDAAERKKVEWALHLHLLSGKPIFYT